jgi:hypothetical protein
VNPYSSAAAGLADEEGNRYSAAAADLANAQRTTLRANVTAAGASAPDAAAGAMRLSRQVGAPLELVQRNLPAVQQRAAADRVDADTRDAPTLRSRYADPAFAAVAHDDSRALANIERAVGKFTSYLMGATPQGGLQGDMVAGVYRASAGAAGVFRAASETAAVPFDVLERFPSVGGNPLRRLAEGFARLGEANRVQADKRTAPPDGIVSAGVSSGVQSAVQSLLMAPMALLPGGQPAALAGMSATSGGQSYQAAREAGVGQGSALVYGASDAVIEYATERLPLSRLLGDLKAGTGAMKTLLRQLAADIPGEQLATVLQDANEWATINPQKTLREYVQDRPSAAAQTLIASVIGSGGNVAVMKGAQAAIERITVALDRGQKAQADAQQLAGVIEAANDSALRQRDPETFADLVEHLQPETRLYVAPEHLAGIDLSAVPNIAQQAAEAAATGGDVQVSLADLLAHLPGEQLLPHLRTTPSALTVTEAMTLDTLDGADQAAMDSSLVLTLPDGSMTPADWAGYLRESEESAQSAIESREARSLRDMRWLANRKGEALQALNREAQAARGALEQQVIEAVQQSPVYAAQRALDGTDMPADFVAEQFGYRSADDLRQAIANAKPEAEAIDDALDQAMREQHPDLADAIARERSAEAMVSERARTRFLATEAAALSKALGSRQAMEREAQRYAAATIAQRAVRDVRPAQFEAAAERAGKRAAMAFRKGDTAAAAQAKRDQVLQSALQSEAVGVVDEVDRALAAFKRMTRPDDGTRDGNLASAARAILAQYGLASADKTAADYLAQVEHYDPELHADLLVLIDGMPAPSPHRELTVGDFRAMRDRVEAIWSLARSTRQLEIDGQKVEIAAAAAALADQLGPTAAPASQTVGTNQKLDLRMRLAGVMAALRRVEHWADARDKGRADGPFRKILWQPISEAVTRYRAHRNAHVNRFLQLLKTIEPTLKPGKIAAPELSDNTVFADRSALLHALLHTGNESNRRKLLLGYGWGVLREDGSLDDTRWQRFLKRMHDEGRITAADWQFVQSTWDLLENMKAPAQQAHKAMFGHYFDEITAESVDTPFGELRGGYVPAITDSLLVTEARSHGAMDDMLASQNSVMFPAVNRGFTKSRIEVYTKPLALDLRLVPAHIDKVARFTVLGPVLRDTARLVTRNKAFRSAMDAHDATAVESMLVPWLKRTAQQTLTKAPETQADRAVTRIATKVRNRTGLLLMSANVVNTLQQFTGLSVAALKVNPRHLGAGLMQLMRNPQSTVRAINELSPWMQQRADNSASDVERTINELLTNPNALQRVEQLGTRYGYALQQTAQNLLDRVVWLGAYRQAEAQGVREAARAADSAVRLTQGSFAPEDAAKVEHAGGFTRLFLQFYSYFGGQANLLATEVQNARGRPGRLALVYLLGFAIPAFVADVIAKGMRGQLGDDDEDGDELADQLLRAFFVSQARYALGMAPVVGQVGNAALGQLTPEGYDDRIGASPAYSAIEATVRAPRSIARAIEGDGNPRTAVRDGLTAVGLLTGLPVGPLVRPLGHLVDEEAEEVSLRGLLTGRAER